MSTVNTTGDLSTILAVDPFSVNGAVNQGNNFFDLHAYIAFDDFYNLDYVATIDTPTYLEAFLTFANGDAIFTGTDMDLIVGTVDTIDFVGDGGSFSFAGLLTYSYGSIDKWDFTSVSAMNGTEGYLMEGKLRLSPNGGMHGTATRQVAYTNGVEIEYIGSFGAGTQKGFYTNINVTDVNGSFSLAGNFAKSAVTTATFVCFTFDEFLDYAALFKNGDTYTVNDGQREWHGFDGNDKMYGGAAIDTLTGDAGNDTLDGGAGDDILSGGIGNDLYFVDGAGDVIVELAGGGTDTVSSAVSYDLGLQAANTENLTLTGVLDIDATGTAGINSLTGNSGNNRLDGGAGADKMAGGAGNDTFVVDNTGDRITDTSGLDTVESSLNFTLAPGLENLELYGAALRGTGNSAGNVITGNANANVFSGLGGNDILDGGIGADTLTGGTGADIFTFTATDGVSDTVTDFNRTLGDKIDISDLLTGFDPMTDDITQFVRIDTVGTGSVLFVDADGGGDSFIQIATLTRATALTDEDALLTAGVLIAS
ncbi:MAG: calcium-binding protein [bacterium]|nr:calcium-binding protein [bacterium]